MEKAAKNIKVVLMIIVLIVVLMCALFYAYSLLIQNEIEHEWWPKSINTCIEETNLDYDEIRTLICDPGPNVGLKSKGYDLLGKLTNLESITLVAVCSKDFAQDIFTELTNLKSLHTIVIEDSQIGSIDKLAEIDGLTNLSVTSTSSSDLYITEGFENKNFKSIMSLSFSLTCVQAFPDLTSMKNLEKLKVTGYDLSELPYDKVNWKNIVSLDISYSSVEIIDDRIINELSNLKELNIEHSNISDMEFILSLPSLEKTDMGF